jgi:competence protein ComEC
MKRLFGLIGLTYLSVQIVVYYFYCTLTVVVVLAISLFLIIMGAVSLIVKHRRKVCKIKINKDLLIAGISAACACLAIVLFASCCYLPIINQYSNKEIKISGYICDEVELRESSRIYTIQTTSVNSKKENIKLRFIAYTDLDLEPFDCINSSLVVYSGCSNSLISKGVYFTAYSTDGYTIEKTGEKYASLYSLAVKVRTSIKSSLDLLLPEKYSSMCKAVLLGDKISLSYDIYGDFSKTGTSFLIVVSGLHLSVMISFALFLIKKITKNKTLRCISVCITVVAFMAVTGFNSSVVRSGVMTMIAYCATIFLRRSDSLNSMGFAALVLTLPNPYAVADVGLILSFSATMGIILWSGKIYLYIISKLEIKHSLLRAMVNLLSVSIAASIWIIPISTLYFEKVSPLVMFVSCMAEPIVSVLLVCALIAAVLYLMPFISCLAYPFALVCGLLSKALIFVVSTFALIPYASVNSGKPYFYVWIAVTVALVAVGYIIKSKSLYIRSAIAISFVTLTIGCAVYSVIGEYTCKLTVYNVKSGITASVESGSNILLFSCGGSRSQSESVIKDISKDFYSIDYMIIPNDNNNYSRLQSEFVNEFDVSNILVYDSDGSSAFFDEYDGNVRSTFGENVQFEIELSQGVTDKVLNIDGITYQLIQSEDTSMLFVPDGADISKLPQDFVNVDYVLLDSIPEDADLLNCKTLIYSESELEYNKNYNSLKEICDNILTTANGNIVIE